MSEPRARMCDVEQLIYGATPDVPTPEGRLLGEMWISSTHAPRKWGAPQTKPRRGDKGPRRVRELFGRSR